MNNADLKPCPNCGKKAGELVVDERSFPYCIRCNGCGYIAAAGKLRVALNLWNRTAKRSEEE